MDFFGAQARARQQSRLLGWAFALTLLLVILALNLVVLTLLRVYYAAGRDGEPFGASLAEWSFGHPGTVLLTSLLVGGFIGVASLTRMLQLREGGGYVARAVGGVRVERGTPDPKRRMLSNIVDEMALAAGIPAPEVYVLEQEDSINAFAAGHTPANAAVAVTRGALLKLNRDQLQGVIAHEFSHVLNGDMRISIRLMGLVFGLMAVSLAGRMLIRLSSNGDKKAGPILLLGLGIALIGQIGFWGGRLLQAWISRQRECLADASAVQFTRNPDGLRDALVRAAALGGSRRFANASMEQVAHMLFVAGSPRLLATHPPLLQRLQALDPNINQAQLESMLRRAQAQWRESAAAQPAAPTSAAVEPALPDLPAPPPRGVPASAQRIAASTGLPGPRHLAFAVALRQALPDSLRASAAAPEQARALLLALVASEDASLRQRQLELITQRLGADDAESVRALSGRSRALQPLHRLPAVLQLFAPLRALPASERLSLSALLHDMLTCDGRLSVFEYSLEKLAIRALNPQSAAAPPHGGLGVEDRIEPLGVVFAVLARHGASSDSEARRAYEAGLAPLLPRIRPAYHVIDDWVPVFDTALDSLQALQATAKQMVIEALVRTIAHDSSLAPEEAELLRAICGVLECPLPPLLPEAA